MPLNYPFGSIKNNFNPDEFPHTGFVKQCIQLANLHSHLLRKAAVKHKSAPTGVPYPFEYEQQFNSDFFKINGKEHPDGITKILDPADRTAFREYQRLGCDLLPHSLAYEHAFDEYMTYAEGEAGEPKAQVIQATRSFVYSAL